MNFDYWQRWGVDLDDVSFANAWVALGLTRGEPGEQSGGHAGLQARESKRRWRFPQPGKHEALSPKEWAQRWVTERDRLGPVRLLVSDAPAGERILPWYRLFGEARPALDAVSLSIRVARAQLDMGWPLRLGRLSDDAAGVLEATMKDWPASKLALPLRLGRDDANCDFLLYKGQASALLRELLDTPAALKANVLLLQGGDEADWGEIRALLVPLLDRLRASGFVLLPRGLADDRLAAALNGIIRELSHGNPLDVALEASAREFKPGDVVAGFTPALTRFTAPQLVARMNARIAALPKGTTLDMSHVGRPDEWLARGVRGGGIRGGKLKAKMALPPDADRRIAAESVALGGAGLTFDHEHEGSSAIADVAMSAAAASPPPQAAEERAARFLQQQSFVRQGGEYRKATEGFIAGAPALVRARIAVPESGWDSLPEAFPVEALPQHLEEWTLTLWLTELDHLAAPLRGQIKLPRDGNSTECEFRFKPRDEPRFEGRITVLHRGRVIQTAVLRAGVIVAGRPAPKDGAPRFEDKVAVRHRLGNLDTRRRFDLALVANHDAKGRPLLAAVSDKAAWVKDLSAMDAISAAINTSLSAVARSVEDYQQGLAGEKGRQLIVQLAQHGGWLKIFFDEQLNAAGNNPAIAGEQYVQIVSTRADAVVPLEFVYDHAVPEDDAKLCRGWRKALETGACVSDCDHASSRTVCPMGFWGLSKVIERHAVTPGLARDGNLLYLQSETSRENDTLRLGGVAVLGASARVKEPDLKALEQAIAGRSGVAPKRAKSWTQWEELVKKHRPSLLVSLPHTDGKRSNVTLEIGDVVLKTITLKDTHVFPQPPEGHQAPLVALLGCDTAGTADDYGHHVVVLRAHGAGIVIGTIATVFGAHAARVARELVEELPKAGASPERLGELMRALKRKSLLDGLLMPLCIVAYGDADWKLSHDKPLEGPAHG